MTVTAHGAIPPPPTGPPPPPVPDRPEWQPVARAVGLGLYAGALVAWCATKGIPLDREQIFLWLAAGLIVASVGSPKGGPWRVVRDWLPVALVLILYDL